MINHKCKQPNAKVASNKKSTLFHKRVLPYLFTN